MSDPRTPFDGAGIETGLPGAQLNAPDPGASIGDVRRRTGMTSRAIRFYEDIGLFRTSRDHRGLRRYDQVALQRLAFIGQARLAGLSIARIAELLALADRDGEAAMAARALELYRGRLSDLQEQREAIEAAAQALGGCLRPARPQLVALRA